MKVRAGSVLTPMPAQRFPTRGKASRFPVQGAELTSVDQPHDLVNRAAGVDAPWQWPRGAHLADENGVIGREPLLCVEAGIDWLGGAVAGENQERRAGVEVSVFDSSPLQSLSETFDRPVDVFGGVCDPFALIRIGRHQRVSPPSGNASAGKLNLRPDLFPGILPRGLSKRRIDLLDNVHSSRPPQLHHGVGPRALEDRVQLGLPQPVALASLR